MAGFWFMLQIAILAGFSTAYAASWFMMSKGIKEKI